MNYALREKLYEPVIRVSFNHEDLVVHEIVPARRRRAWIVSEDAGKGAGMRQLVMQAVSRNEAGKIRQNEQNWHRHELFNFVHSVHSV